MPSITNAKILIVATHGFEQSELEVPRDALRKRGAVVHVASPDGRNIRGWDEKDWGDEVEVDGKIDKIHLDQYDAVVLPGGQINPDILRTSPEAVQLVHDAVRSGKVVAAICHGPWLLIEAGVAQGREMTSYPSIRTDLANAGAIVKDAPVVTDNGIVTSRNPGDLEAFVSKIVEQIEEGRHTRAA